MKTKTHHILGKKISVTFPEKGYRGGIDPVFLAALARGTGNVIELGCGVGTAALCVKHHHPKCTITLMDISAPSLEMATLNFKNNSLEATFIQGDVKDKGSLPLNHYDEVIINPPYFEDGHYFQDTQTTRALTNHEGEGGALLKNWVDAANRCLNAKGVLTLIHRTERLDDILALLKEKKFGEIHVFPLFPQDGKPSKICLIQAQKGRKSGLTLHPGMVLHAGEKQYTQAAQAILYEGKKINLNAKMV